MKIIGHDGAINITALRVLKSKSTYMHSFKLLMGLIHYSLAPLILFLVPYTVGLLPYYLSFAYGAGDVDIFKIHVFQCFVVKQSN